ncbi:unnamed protein product [Cuscuta campestris]|uniref:Uncharacterized protein n=1 Tax=Cuscuta campestris TaxID=132261 RepID=A0A484LAB7_9ASTE|nr:unnamed protein product [Cuscuta campestris]
MATDGKAIGGRIRKGLAPQSLELIDLGEEAGSSEEGADPPERFRETGIPSDMARIEEKKIFENAVRILSSEQIHPAAQTGTAVQITPLPGMAGIRREVAGVAGSFAGTESRPAADPPSLETNETAGIAGGTHWFFLAGGEPLEPAGLPVVTVFVSIHDLAGVVTRAYSRCRPWVEEDRHR